MPADDHGGRKDSDKLVRVGAPCQCDHPAPRGTPPGPRPSATRHEPIRRHATHGSAGCRPNRDRGPRAGRPGGGPGLGGIRAPRRHSNRGDAAPRAARADRRARGPRAPRTRRVTACARPAVGAARPGPRTVGGPEGPRGGRVRVAGATTPARNRRGPPARRSPAVTPARKGQSDSGPLRRGVSEPPNAAVPGHAGGRWQGGSARAAGGGCHVAADPTAVINVERLYCILTILR
jgi:hypothetical protein